MRLAVEAVGYAFGADADCAAASALVKLISDRLGVHLTPRSVSVVLEELSSDTKGFMGPKATALVKPDEMARMENYRQESKDTGHMVVISKDPPTLFDANLGQLRAYGVNAPDSLALPIDSTEPKSGEWKADLGDLQLTYMLDENPALWDRYEAALVGHKEDAERLVRLLRGGSSMQAIKNTMKPKKQIR